MAAKLVYQAGIANVFIDGKRVLQHAFGPCEWLCRGIIAAGGTVEVFNCNRAGDIALWESEWIPGAGGPFAEAQCPLV